MVKIRDKTEETICVFCGKPATRLNREGQPVCREHIDSPPKERYCPECGMPMEIKEGKFGYFWGCTGFPSCKKTLSLRQELNLDKFKKD